MIIYLLFFRACKLPIAFVLLKMRWKSIGVNVKCLNRCLVHSWKLSASRISDIDKIQNWVLENHHPVKENIFYRQDGTNASNIRVLFNEGFFLRFIISLEVDKRSKLCSLDIIMFLFQWNVNKIMKSFFMIWLEPSHHHLPLIVLLWSGIHQLYKASLRISTLCYFTDLLQLQAQSLLAQALETLSPTLSARSTGRPLLRISAGILCGSRSTGNYRTCPSHCIDNLE